MSILENLEQIIQNLNLLINDVWKLVLFETAIQDNSMLVVIWSMVFYFVALFISIYILKIIIEGIFKFIFNPVTFIFIIFIFGLSVWTIIQINDDYENIAYVTGRQFYTCPYVFERTERLEKDALLSYPDFVFLDGRVQENEKGKLFNDMFFSMKSDKMVMYADYSIQQMDYNLQNQIGSEYNLYDFVERNNIEYEWLDFLGLIRNDWQRNNNASDISNYHVC